MNKIIILLCLGLSMGANGALAAVSPSEEPATQPSSDSTFMVPAPNKAPKAVAPGRFNFGPGMKIPVDGTSLEAFDESMDLIKTKTTAAEYTTLVNAIDYLMVYDLQAKRNRARLAGILNGLTGEEIVDRVEWGNNEKQSPSKKAHSAPQDTPAEE